MHIYKSLIAVCAVILLGLSACGGGGGPATTPDPDPDPAPKPPPVAAPASCEDQACVDHYKTAMDTAKAALDAAKKDQNSTQAQIAAAQKAYDAAMKAHGDAVTALAAYVAKQPPTYVAAAMQKALMRALTEGGATADAIDSTLTTTNADSDTVRGGKVTAADYKMKTWPAPPISGWTSGVYEKENTTAKTMDSVVVYTNIDDPTPASWNAYYAGSIPDDHAPWKVVSSTSDAATGKDMRTVTIGTTTTAEQTAIAKNNDLFSIPALGSGKDASISVVGTDDTSTTDVKENEVAGTFRGVAGMYVCGTTTGCGIQNDDEGKLKALLGAWTFRPDEPTGSDTAASIKVAGVKLDTDYLDFGYWFQTNTSGDSATYKVAAFFRGDESWGGTYGSITAGKATYSGDAAGIYTMRESTPAGDGDVAGAGRFTASASLTAVFGEPNTIGSVDHNSIKGTISNFRDSAGESIDNSWVLTLNKITGVNSATFADGTTTGGGAWSGGYYGDGTGDATPASVAGKFTGKFNNGRVVGAFGATKD